MPVRIILPYLSAVIELSWMRAVQEEDRRNCQMSLSITDRHYLAQFSLRLLTEVAILAEQQQRRSRVGCRYNAFALGFWTLGLLLQDQALIEEVLLPRTVPFLSLLYDQTESTGSEVQQEHELTGPGFTTMTAHKIHQGMFIRARAWMASILSPEGIKSTTTSK